MRHNRGFHRDDNFVRIDLKEGRYAGYGALYVFQGILDAVTQNWACRSIRAGGPIAILFGADARLAFLDWLMGAISSQPAQLARLVGIYKGVQSVGAAAAFAMDSGGTSYMNELAATWTVGVAGLIFAIPVVAIRLRKGSEEEIEAAAEVHKHDEVSLASGEKKEEDAMAT